MLKKLKQKLNKQEQVPRAYDEIKQEYAQLIGQAGQAQYQAYAYTAQVASINRRLVEVNQEGEARKKLDAELVEKTKASEVK